MKNKYSPGYEPRTFKSTVWCSTTSAITTIATFSHHVLSLLCYRLEIKRLDFFSEKVSLVIFSSKDRRGPLGADADAADLGCLGCRRRGALVQPRCHRPGNSSIFVQMTIIYSPLEPRTLLI